MRKTTAAAAAAALGLAVLGGVGVGSALMTTAVAESTPIPLANRVGRTKTAAPTAMRPVASAISGVGELTDSPEYWEGRCYR